MIHNMYKDHSIAVIVPAYNEEVLIRPTLETIPDYVDVVYAIDDGSIDNTYTVMREIAEKDPRIVIIRHNPNQGVGSAIVSGYKRVVKDEINIAVVMAGDNQMDPQYIPSLLDPIVKGEVDYTKGNRLSLKEYQHGMSKWRLFGNTVLTYLTRISSGYWDLMDPQNGYTAISLYALNEINVDEIFTWYGYCNDMLVKLNVKNIKIKDISIPAKYGEEKSSIQYPSYIIRVSKLLFSNLIYRVKNTYFK